MSKLTTASLILGALLIAGAAGVAAWQLVESTRPYQPPAPTPFPTPPAGVALTLPPSLGELAEQYPQLAEVLSDPELDSVYKEFAVAYEADGTEGAVRFARERGILTEDFDLRAVLTVDGPDGLSETQLQVEAMGAVVESAYEDEINLRMPLRQLAQSAQEAGGAEAFFRQLTGLEHVIRVGFPAAAQPSETLSAEALTGEGVRATGADAWHRAGQAGQGVKIGILDMGFAGYRELLGSELPEDVTVQSFVPGKAADDTSVFHGTAVAAIVHDMAPGAELFLAYYDGTSASQGLAVEWLASQGVRIINHSAGSEQGPMDGTGRQARRIDELAEGGVLWVNSSGNQGSQHTRVTFADADGDGLHEFPDGNEYMPVSARRASMQITLKWDDWGAPREDYDLLLYDADFKPVASSRNTQAGNRGDEPAELIWYQGAMPGGVYYVGIQAQRQTRPAVFDLFVYAGDPAFPEPPHSLNTPGDAAGSLTVGATSWRDDSLPLYSSQGPTNDGRVKPDLSAPAGVSGTAYGESGFEGTSAAAPHVSGAAALVWGRYPEWNREAVVAFLEGHAVDLGDPGPDPAFGHGRLQLPDPNLEYTPEASPPSGSRQAQRLPRSMGVAIGLLSAGALLLIAGGIALQLQRRKRMAANGPLRETD